MADPDSILPPTGDPAPAPTAKTKLVCEHCECQLTPSGDVLRMSDRARSHLKHAETIEKGKERIAQLESELRDVRAKMAEYSTVRESKMFDLTL